MRNLRPTLDRPAAIVGLATVVAANFLYLTGLPMILDPVVSMEPFYIHMARGSVASVLSADPAWGPLYALWLKPFVAVLGDPLAVYSANLYTLSLGVSVLIYLYILLLTRRAAAGVGVALFFLISDLNVPLSNKVSAFAILVVLAGLTLSELLPRGGRRLSVAATGILFASYARPEFYPAALCLCAVALWLTYRELDGSNRRILWWPVVTAASILVPALLLGVPFLDPSRSSNRLFMAFREHFAWNWSAWHHKSFDFFAAWQQQFDGAESTGQAFLRNPLAFMHHLSANLLGSVKFMVATALDHYPLLAPATSVTLVKAENLLVSVVVFVSLIVVLCRPPLRRQLFDCYGHTFVPYAALAACSLAAGLMIFPLPQYLAMVAALLMLAATLVATVIIPVHRDLSRRTGVLAAVVCLIAVPRPFILPSAYAVPGSPFKARIIVTRTITDTVGFVRSLHLSMPVQVLTLTDGIGEMLGSGFSEVKIWEKGAQPLDAYLHDNDIGVIISLGAGQESFMDNDPEWKRFEITPEATGFTRLAVPNQEAVGIYVRTDLMRKAGSDASALGKTGQEPG